MARSSDELRAGDWLRLIMSHVEALRGDVEKLSQQVKELRRELSEWHSACQEPRVKGGENGSGG